MPSPLPSSTADPVSGEGEVLGGLGRGSRRFAGGCAFDKRGARHDNCSVMKLTISTLACPDWTLAQILDACAAAGVGGVDFRGRGPEIDVTRLRDFTLDLPLTLAEFRARGVAMPCFTTSV